MELDFSTQSRLSSWMVNMKSMQMDCKPSRWVVDDVARCWREVWDDCLTIRSRVEHCATIWPGTPTAVA